MKVTEKDLMAVAKFADTIIKEQKNYIKELEQQIENLQKALDVLQQNKCRVRKVRVKFYGRSPMDKGHSRTF